MAKYVEYFHAFIGHVYLFFGVLSVQFIFSLDWIVFSFDV
jgi:hypothetical protein